MVRKVLRLPEEPSAGSAGPSVRAGRLRRGHDHPCPRGSADPSGVVPDPGDLPGSGDRTQRHMGGHRGYPVRAVPDRDHRIYTYFIIQQLTGTSGVSSRQTAAFLPPRQGK